MKKLVLLLVLCSTLLYAQVEKNELCGTSGATEYLKETVPGYINELKKLDMNIITYGKQDRVITIPVVFHIVWHDSSQNVTNEKIQFQLDVLNRDFRLQNADTANIPSVFKNLKADMMFEFCYAKIAPDGSPTTGITRTYTKEFGFGYWGNFVKFDSTGGKSSWDTKKYLNIWICELYGGLLGYAQFPNGPEQTDGIVIDYLTMSGTLYPTHNKGRIAIHEIGHWFGLRHIWGDGNCAAIDYVYDTPEQSGFHVGCPDSVVTCGSRDLVVNYMDYVNNDCMVMFTTGQKIRAYGMLLMFRHEILASQICDSIAPLAIIDRGGNMVELKIYPSLTSGSIIIQGNTKLKGISKIVIFDSLGKTVMSTKLNLTSSIQLDLRRLRSGMYGIVIINNGKIVSKKRIIINSQMSGSLINVMEVF